MLSYVQIKTPIISRIVRKTRTRIPGSNCSNNHHHIETPDNNHTKIFMNSHLSFYALVGCVELFARYLFYDVGRVSKKTKFEV